MNARARGIVAAAAAGLLAAQWLGWWPSLLVAILAAVTFGAE